MTRRSQHMVIAAIVGQHMDKRQRQAAAIAPMRLQHGIPDLLAGQAQQNHRPHALCMGHSILHQLQATGFELHHTHLRLGRILLLKCLQSLQGPCAHGLAPEAELMLWNKVIKIVASGLNPVTTRKCSLKRFAISQTQTRWAVERGIAQQLYAAPQFPPQAPASARTHSAHGRAHFALSRHKHATFKSAQPFANREAEKTDIALETYRGSINARTQCLSRIFNHISAHGSGAAQGGIHISHAPA